VRTFLLTILAWGGCFIAASAQYAPQAGIAGSTAVPASSPGIVRWATGCRVQRGFQDIAQPGLGLVSNGDSSAAVGAQDGSVVSVGDSGVAVLTFAHPIADGPGADLAVFENGFPNPQNSEEAFLELAFVEVSSDGQFFVRFPAQSLTPVAPQLSSTAGAGYINARALNNLAGKYRGGFGTPFDLAELTGTPGLDIGRITHVRIVDVVGSVGAHASLDSAGRPINEPYPTQFPTGGFDLDAVAVLSSVVAVNDISNTESAAIYPNPTSGDAALHLTVPGARRVLLTDTRGVSVYAVSTTETVIQLPLAPLPAGLYFITVQNSAGSVWRGRVVRQ